MSDSDRPRGPRLIIIRPGVGGHSGSRHCALYHPRSAQRGILDGGTLLHIPTMDSGQAGTHRATGQEHGSDDDTQPPQVEPGTENRGRSSPCTNEACGKDITERVCRHAHSPRRCSATPCTLGCSDPRNRSASQSSWPTWRQSFGLASNSREQPGLSMTTHSGVRLRHRATGYGPR